MRQVEFVAAEEERSGEERKVNSIRETPRTISGEVDLRRREVWLFGKKARASACGGRRSWN